MIHAKNYEKLYQLVKVTSKILLVPFSGHSVYMCCCNFCKAAASERNSPRRWVSERPGTPRTRREVQCRSRSEGNWGNTCNCTVPLAFNKV